MVVPAIKTPICNYLYWLHLLLDPGHRIQNSTTNHNNTKKKKRPKTSNPWGFIKWNNGSCRKFDIDTHWSSHTIQTSGVPPCTQHMSGWLIQRDESIRSKSGFVTTHIFICAQQLSWDTRHMLDTLQRLLYHTITETEQHWLQAVELTCDLLLIALVSILLGSKLLDTKKLCHVGNRQTQNP